MTGIYGKPGANIMSNKEKPIASHQHRDGGDYTPLLTNGSNHGYRPSHPSRLSPLLLIPGVLAYAI